MAKKTPTQAFTERVQRDAKARERETQRRANPAVTPAQLRESFADLDAIDVLERRLLNPDADQVLPIRLKDEPDHHVDPLGTKRRWYLRWFNTSIPNRFHTATASLGYTPVLWPELRDREIVSNPFNGSEQVRRGDRGVEVLCKIPMPYYLKFKKQQHDKQAAALQPRAMREAAKNAAAKAGLDPDEHEDVGGVVGEIKVGRERLVSSLDE